MLFSEARLPCACCTRGMNTMRRTRSSRCTGAKRPSPILACFGLACLLAAYAFAAAVEAGKNC